MNTILLFGIFILGACVGYCIASLINNYRYEKYLKYAEQAYESTLQGYRKLVDDILDHYKSRIKTGDLS